MTINRNNYEEYFLLYVDRELNGDEQNMVEEFVKLHPTAVTSLRPRSSIRRFVDQSKNLRRTVGTLRDCRFMKTV